MATDRPNDPEATTPDSRPSSSLHGRFEPGARLGTRYRIVGLLGRGGMGEVYRADDLELNQSVALKFLPEHVGRSADDLARLRQEVRIARQIAHPNVCRTYDIAEADGHVFVVMEYVDGEDLASVLRRLGRPTPDKAVEIARAICLGLGAAHENGVIHRDLKPANIMIDGRGRVRITDFGIAGTVEELRAPGGGIAGTVEYMAPELLASGTASIPSDVYALGLVLFEIFTGKRASEVAPSGDPLKADSDGLMRPPSSVVAGIDPAVERVGQALVAATIMTLAYLAIEPFLRRIWPQALVSWARLAVGRVRDPIVGRDVLVKPRPSPPTPAAARPESSAWRAPRRPGRSPRRA